MFENIFANPFVATCPASPKQVGQSVSLTGKVSNGRPPYSLVFKKDGSPIPGGSFSGIAENTNVSVTYTLLPSDVGIKTFSMTASDSCPDGARTCTETCNVTVVPPCTLTSCGFSVG